MSMSSFLATALSSPLPSLTHSSLLYRTATPVIAGLGASITTTTTTTPLNVLEAREQGFSASPTTSCCSPDIVVIHIETALTVSNFHAIYGDNIFAFEPTYSITPDGSLISAPLEQNLKVAAENLLLLGGFIVLFLWNSFTALGFIMRTTVKDKSIFYLLLTSQLTALVPWVVLTVGVFSPPNDCRTIFRVAELFLFAATSFVLTGVFGLKAYRCLFSSRLVAFGLSVFQIAHLGLVVVRVVNMQSYRQLIGTCGESNVNDLIPVTLGVIFMETVFVAICFMYAVCRSSRILAAQGRLSFRESLGDGHPVSPRDDGSIRILSRVNTHSPTDQSPPPIVDIPAQSNVEKKSPPESTVIHRYASRKIRVKQTIDSWVLKLRGQVVTNVVSMTNGQSLRLSSLKPRMVLFREVMRDELCYTTVMAAASVVSAIVALVATSRHMWISEHGWISFQLAVMSALAVHSLHRVVRRNEHEALLQDPRFWDPMRRAAQVGSRFDSLESVNFSLEHDTVPRRSQNINPLETRTHSSWQWDARASLTSQGSDRAILSHRERSESIVDCEQETRRASYDSSLQSIHSIESDYLAHPLSINTVPNLALPTDWTQVPVTGSL